MDVERPLKSIYEYIQIKEAVDTYVYRQTKIFDYLENSAAIGSSQLYLLNQQTYEARAAY